MIPIDLIELKTIVRAVDQKLNRAKSKPIQWHLPYMYLNIKTLCYGLRAIRDIGKEIGYIPSLYMR